MLPFTVDVSSTGCRAAPIATIAPTAPAAPARCVLNTILPMSADAATVLPPLKPNQPSHRMKPPSATEVRLWPGIMRAVPSAPKRPSRGCTTSSAASAHQPPTECTTVEPAKSMKPILRSQPSPPYRLPHAQLPNTGYTTPVMTHEPAMYAQKRVRSAIAPLTIVAAVAANIVWKNSHA